jgi:hypothetical protein
MLLLLDDFLRQRLGTLLLLESPCLWLHVIQLKQQSYFLHNAKGAAGLD